MFNLNQPFNNTSQSLTHPLHCLLYDEAVLLTSGDDALSHVLTHSGNITRN